MLISVVVTWRYQRVDKLRIVPPFNIKEMKKYLFYFCFSICLGLLSCGGDDKNNPIDEPVTPTISVDKAIIGNWAFTLFHISDASFTKDEKEYPSGTLQVNQDGTFIMKGDIIGKFYTEYYGNLPSEISGTYSLVDSKSLYLNLDNKYNSLSVQWGNPYDITIYYNENKLLEMDLHKKNRWGEHLLWCFVRK